MSALVKRIESLETENARLRAALKNAKIDHYGNEIDYYVDYVSCNKIKGVGECDCGADEHNAAIDEALRGKE